MTGQMHDMVVYDETNYSLAGIKGSKLFNPSEYDLEPISTITACWRGYLVIYIIKDKKLSLDALFINLEQPKKIEAVKPKKSEISFFQYMYEFHSHQIKLDFTGILFLGRTLISDLYEHGGFQHPLSFKDVLACKLEDNEVVYVKDISNLVKQKREGNEFSNLDPSMRGIVTILDDPYLVE